MALLDISQKKPGDIVWAFAYQNGDKIRGQKLRQKPVRGMLISDYYPNCTDIKPCVNPNEPARWFAPFNKNDEPRMSAIVRIDNRKYAETESEAIEGYNLEVKREIKMHETAIQEHYKMLISTLDQTPDEDGYYEQTAVYRADMAINAEEIIMSLKDDLVPLDTSTGDLMPWDSFVRQVDNGGLTDYDGAADLIIDDRASSNCIVWITTNMVNIYDKYLVPFSRIPEIFKNHKIEIMWFNK